MERQLEQRIPTTITVDIGALLGAGKRVQSDEQPPREVWTCHEVDFVVLIRCRLCQTL